MSTYAELYLLEIQLDLQRPSWGGGGFGSPSCSALPHTQTFMLRKQKAPHVCPTVLETGYGGQASWARLLPDAGAELHVTPPHTVSA